MHAMDCDNWGFGRFSVSNYFSPFNFLLFLEKYKGLKAASDKCDAEKTISQGEDESTDIQVTRMISNCQILDPNMADCVICVEEALVISPGTELSHFEESPPPTNCCKQNVYYRCLRRWFFMQVLRDVDMICPVCREKFKDVWSEQLLQRGKRD